MEAELTGWLRGFEPGGTPVALRVRTFADLRDEAERPRPRFVWLRPTLSAVASLGAVALVAGAIMVLSVVLGGAGHGVGGPGQVGPTGPAIPAGPSDGVGQVGPVYGSTQSPIALVLYLLLICVAGATAFVPRVRWFVGRIVGSAEWAAPGALLPYRRSLREVPPLAWLMGAAAIGVGALVLLNRQFDYGQPPSYLSLDYAIEIYPRLLVLLFAFVIALRYPMSDRSGRFLSIGAVSAMAATLVFTGASLAHFWLDGLLFIGAALNIVGVGLVVGVAGRARVIRKPPLWLAAAALSGAFGLVFGNTFLNWFQWGDNVLDPIQIPSLADDLARWIAAAGAAGILWVGICAWRRNGGSWAWRLVLVAGALGMVSWSGYALGLLAQAGLLDSALFTSVLGWLNLAGTIGRTALLVALAIGLRPASPSGEPKPADLDQDFPNEIAPHTEVAGEAAGH
jgi:hypothetical protein